MDWATGDVAAPEDAPRYVVAAPRDPRFRLAGRLHANNVGLVVREVDLPYRALWATRGLQADGWTEPGRPTTLRIYNRDDRDVLMRVRIGVRAAPTASARYRILAPGVRRPGALEPDEPRLVSFPLCVPAASSTDVTVEGFSAARFDPVQLSPGLEGTRRVGVLVGPILVAPTDAAC